jgi:precorrin-3B synthase
MRDRVDACPGVLTLHEAADGLLARVRVPGGALSRDQLAVLAAAATDFGTGSIELTSRANLQLRGIAEAARQHLGDRLAQAGLLPSATHERVRNIVATPLSGIDTYPDDVGDLVAALDRGLCARAELADLPGRFLFAIDDGRHDVADLGADLTIVACGDRAWVEGVDVARAEAVPLALTLAAAFLDERRSQGSDAWRIAELNGGIGGVLERAGVAHAPAADRVEPAPVRTRTAGVVEQPDGRQALLALAPFGTLQTGQVAILLELAGARGVRFTPWRSVVVPDLADAGAAVIAARTAGFGVDPISPWHRVSACTGRPGCASALADVRTDALARLDGWPGQRVRWSGCERRCGRPHDTDVDVVATLSGYVVTRSPGA